MVKVFIKGGVWKNSEDEILKAAVQKYGKQQWARVASLLNRKTAKQCKARWHEWLDPSVKKIEWSRQEEEKLLHLAKLMPAQWKTIAPVIGRTASQCQEHYELLLDQAANAASLNKNDKDSSAAAEGVAGAAGSSLRKQQYQPGQIDSHPETKPARPDPIDMDEDEIEMLQEARARLANTQGKKAKRKAREKMLAQAKRLADLQKRRELKQAGLISNAARTKSRRKRLRGGDIDLGVEIPFHKPTPAGFHDTSHEEVMGEKQREKKLKNIDYKKINETQYRTRDREERQAKKREQNRLRMLEKSNMAYVVQQVSKQNDPANIIASKPRTPLLLPPPTVSDNELMKLAKLQKQQLEQQNSTDPGGGAETAATQVLLGDYSNRPLPTPMRTPMTTSGSSQDKILRDASQLRMLEQGQTPLLGAQHVITGEGEDDEEQDDNDFDNNDEATIRTAATPGGRGTSQTPLSLPASSSSVLRGEGSSTKARDELGLNQRPLSELRKVDNNHDHDNYSVGASTFATATTAATLSIKQLAREQRRAAKRARLELEQALASLPAPQFEYELAIPDDDQLQQQGDDDDDQQKFKSNLIEPDAADIERQKREELISQAKKLYEARNSVIKRKDLPRPSKTPKEEEFIQAATENIIDEATKRAQDLIQKEMLTLLQYDAYAFPIISTSDGDDNEKGDDNNNETDKKKKKKKRKKSGDSSDDNNTVTTTGNEPIVPKDLEVLPEESLNMAKELVQKEFDDILQEKATQFFSLHSSNNDTIDTSEDVILQYLANVNHQVSEENANASSSNDQQLWKMQVKLKNLKNQTDTLIKKNDKLESKINIKNGGYNKRYNKLCEDIKNLYIELSNLNIEKSVYLKLKKQEFFGGHYRIEKLTNEINLLLSDEKVLQKRYSDLILEKKRKEKQSTKQIE